MTISEMAIKTPFEKADKDFIEQALNELLEDIEYIENKFHVTLDKDRESFPLARKEWLVLNYIQVSQIVSTWKSEIFTRFKDLV